jgi:addiction module HigA family antidote
MTTQKPVHPGEILSEDFMKPYNISQNALARALHVSPSRINEIVNGDRPITAETALRLGFCFGTSAELWINLQAEYDLRMARRKAGHKIEDEVEHLALVAA